jgi:dTDP-4-dehydrorhamnose reductase
MRILLFGSEGQVGWELHRLLTPFSEVLTLDRLEVDFNDLVQLRTLTLDRKPDLIVNAAAYTSVDKAETEPDLVMRVNGDAPGVLAEAARSLNAGLIHYSTDYVFDGTKLEPYTEEDNPNPLNVYGQAKLAGDRAIMASGCTYLILRTSWLYGIRGRNFLLTILHLAKDREIIRVVNDQMTSSTPESILKRVEGLYNYSSHGECSWFEFAQIILEKARVREESLGKVEPIPTEEGRHRARRPLYSVLDITKFERTFGLRIDTYLDQFESCWVALNKAKPNRANR